MARIFPLANGSMFVAKNRYVPKAAPFGGLDSEDACRDWVTKKWSMLFELKRGETERLKMCENFYSGHHYEQAWDNRHNPITNYCFSTVETVWPILTQARPRPEPVPRRWMDAQRIRRLRDFATYKMDVSGFDRVFRLCVRDILKYGWTCPMLGFNSQGSSIPQYLSPFDAYFDAATHEDEVEIFAIARPVSVRRLRAVFPKLASRIQPDNIASPSYDVLVKPYIEDAGLGGQGSYPAVMGTMMSAVFEGDPAAHTTGSYVVDTGVFQSFGQTAFLIQMFVRDYRTQTVRYEGDRIDQTPFGDISIPYSQRVEEPLSPSGWCMVPMLANGVILDVPKPVSVCLGGIPLVIGRNYEQGGRFYASGELDAIIPIQRDINRVDANLARALELQANPPVKVSIDARIGADRSSVEAGELISIARGAIMEYLQPGSLAESHFERRAGRRQDIQIVGGTPDSLAGQRPVGIEAGTAIRQLNEQATSRARAKSSSLLEWAAVLLTKMMRCDARKSTELIYFQGNDGQDMWMNPEEVAPDDFDIRWAQDSGTAQGEKDRQDLDLQLLQLGVIDGQQVLEDLDYPDRGSISQRMAMRQMLAAQQGAGPGGPRK